MKDTTSRRMRVRRFITDRYAYRAQPDYSSELITFGVNRPHRLLVDVCIGWRDGRDAEMSPNRTERIL
jgi:hypothetical protein